MNSMSAATDFDFLIGNWSVWHRRLKRRLVSCDEWDEFGGVCSAQKILGGLGNFDDNEIDLPGGAYREITLRVFDPGTRRWAIWWLDARAPHSLDVPMIGAFENSAGVFYADDFVNGRPVRVRFLWSYADGSVPAWEQAFSADGGASWETNWLMQFRRR